MLVVIIYATVLRTCTVPGTALYSGNIKMNYLLSPPSSDSVWRGRQYEALGLEGEAGSLVSEPLGKGSPLPPALFLGSSACINSHTSGGTPGKWILGIQFGGYSAGLYAPTWQGLYSRR